MTPQYSEHTHVSVDLDVLPNEFNFSVRVLDERCKTLLDSLNLLRHSTKNTLFETIELVETTPGTDLTKTDEDTTHGLEVERLVTTEDKDEATELYTESLDRFRFACKEM